jgi:hypothetical protein
VTLKGCGSGRIPQVEQGVEVYELVIIRDSNWAQEIKRSCRIRNRTREQRLMPEKKGKKCVVLMRLDGRDSRSSKG